MLHHDEYDTFLYIVLWNIERFIHLHIWACRFDSYMAIYGLLATISFYFSIIYMFAFHTRDVCVSYLASMSFIVIDEIMLMKLSLFCCWSLGQ